MSCICPTRQRRHWLKRAIQCWNAQAWPVRELIVLEDGGEDNSDLLPPGAIYLRLNGRLSIGSKRNVLCEHARGDVIAHWDDDDWSHPERLREQMALIQSGIVVTGYHTLPFDGPGDQAWLYSNHAQYALGTSLVYRRDWWAQHRFPAIQVGEDTEFVAAAAGVIHSTDGSRRMVATTHDNNTSPRQLATRQWRRIDRGELPQEYLNERLVLHPECATVR